MTDIQRWERIGRQLGGGWLAGERFEARMDWQERKREREQGMTDAATIVKNAASKSARVYSEWKAETERVRKDVMIPEAGRLYKTGELRSDAISQLSTLAEQVEAAAHVQKARLAIRRDDLRPKVSEATRARIEGYYTRLADSGVDLERLIDLADGDATALRCLEDLAPVLAMAQNPNDPRVGEGFREAVQHAALNAYSDAYRAANDEIAAFEKQSYFAEMAVNQALGRVKDNDVPMIPNVKGEIVYDGSVA
jgi:hypothetical protein